MNRYRQDGDLQNPLAVCTQAAWEKLHRYYLETDKAYHLYAASTLFNPEQRMSYFNRNWTVTLDKYKNQMLARIRKEWERSYKLETTTTVVSKPLNPPSIIDIQLGHEPHNDTEDPLNEYAFSAPVTLQEATTQGMLAWWDKHGHPQLKQMAFDSLSIPATTCDLERVFSSSGHLTDVTMSRMTDETIEMRQCLCSWLKDSLIELQIS
jgi:hypothetical protein